jgi:cysteine desulfurase
MRAYLDWNATTPPHPDVLDAMRDAAANAWGNPASIHSTGRAARAVVEDARAAVAALTATDARDVVFTSGGTEANNIALRSALARGGVLATSRLEHPSVTRVAEALEREGRARVRWLGVLPSGVVDLEDLERVLAEGSVALVTVQAMNHETGIVQPVAEVLAAARRAGARVHVDAVQAWGKVEVPPGWDTASLAGHKMRGPKGIGALVVRAGVRLEPVLLGGAQERGVRPGTGSAALASGLGAAARIARTSAARWRALAPLRDRLERDLVGIGGGARVAGDPSLRAPHVSTLIWPGWAGAELVAALDLEGVSVSSGAACSAGTIEPSPVLRVMLGDEGAASGVRISIGDATTEAELRLAVEAFRTVIARSRVRPARPASQ